MNDAHPKSPAATGHGDGAWPVRRWLALIAIVFAAHVVLIFAFGGRQPAAGGGEGRGNVLRLTLADTSSTLIALGDPTLFAQPHGDDIAGMDVLGKIRPSFRWTKPAGELASPAAQDLGGVFNRFMQTNQFAGVKPDLKPAPELSQPKMPSDIAVSLPRGSTLRITGDLAQRKLLSKTALPPLPWNSVAAPSRVQALVDAAGDVVSAVLLPVNNTMEAAGRADVADEKALQFARALRFSPAPGATFGELIFNWLPVPMTATNAL